MDSEEQRELTAGEFVKILEGNTDPEYARFYEGYSYSQDAIVFENVIIKEPVICEGKTLDKDIFIVSGSFDGLRFKGCTFTNGVRIDGGIFNKMFGLEDNKFHKGFTIQGGMFRNDLVVFDGTGTCNLFLIDGGEYKENVLIYGSQFNEFQIKKGVFRKEFTIEGGVFMESLSISGGHFQIFTIENGAFNKSVWIEGGQYDQRFSLLGGTFDRVFVISSESNGELRIEKLQLSFKQNLVKLVKLTNNDDKLFLNYLEFTDTILAKDAFVQLEKIKIKSLNFQATHNYGNISFSQVQPIDSIQECVLSIVNSDMGRTTLIDSNLSSFLFHFQSSKITEVFISGTQLPDEITPTTLQQKDEKLLWEQQRLGYGQLKKIYESRGDIVTANLYFSREMNSYFNTLSWTKQFWEKINLSLNKLSTNHGLSWQRGLLTTLLFSGFFYTLYCFALGYFPCYCKNSFSNFLRLFSFFIEFINPIHKADYIANELKVSVNGFARITEGIGRICSGYFIYQLIQAFRKHGRKT